MKMWAGVVALMLLPINAPADETRSDGNEFLRNCSLAVRYNDGDKKLSTSEHIYSAYCLGYLRGIMDMALVYRVSQPKGLHFFCIPEKGISNGQAARIVVKYLKENPEQLHEDQFALAILALKSAFPCK